MPKHCLVICLSALSKQWKHGASRREGAERFEISARSAVKCLQRWRDHGACVPRAAPERTRRERVGAGFGSRAFLIDATGVYR
jgi:hypothetical protein